MTEPVTRALPPGWQGAYDLDRAAAWIAERDAQGQTLLVANRNSGEPVGLIILFESAAIEGVDVRLGYLMAESTWGSGLASELVEGFVGWCRRQGHIRSIAGGVASDNPASVRVLEKNGFVPLGSTEPDLARETIYALCFDA